MSYTCDGCGGMIEGSPNSTWFRCSECVDTDICHECYKKDIHIHHKAYLQLFTVSPIWDTTYCDACGMYFTDPNSAVFECRKCEDYCLCTKCHHNLHHFHHSKYMKEVGVQQYITEIG